MSFIVELKASGMKVTFRKNNMQVNLPGKTRLDDIVDADLKIKQISWFCKKKERDSQTKQNKRRLVKVKTNEMELHREMG